MALWQLKLREKPHLTRETKKRDLERHSMRWVELLVYPALGIDPGEEKAALRKGLLNSVYEPNQVSWVPPAMRT